MVFNFFVNEKDFSIDEDIVVGMLWIIDLLEGLLEFSGDESLFVPGVFEFEELDDSSLTIADAFEYSLPLLFPVFALLELTDHANDFKEN